MFNKRLNGNAFFSCITTYQLLVKQLMYGFGDVPNPSNDAVSVMEDMLVEYLTDTVSVDCVQIRLFTFARDNAAHVACTDWICGQY